MNRALLLAFPALLAAGTGCAAPSSAPEPEARAWVASAVPPRPDGQGTAGPPGAAAVASAIDALGHPDPERRLEAHRLLRAAGPELEPRLRVLAAGETAGSDLRLEVLGLLSERGDPLEDVAVKERVRLSLREIAREGRDSYRGMRGLARIEALGPAAGPALAEAARAGGPEGRVADRLLRARAAAGDSPEPVR